ncbi:CocE/NonD family hydrolase [Pseudonocardia sp. GCM10023141]|uniref:CocE/NonD family hydrolase n=1 Tax=Pseudonocardia sp. GCM10023141 TaxID=3252653 RepID=UPI0036222108
MSGALGSSNRSGMGMVPPWPELVHPWRRPGAVRYGLARLWSILRPPITIHQPAPGTLHVERDVAAVVRDGTVLRVNVHRPPGPGPFPVILSAHPYGKDSVPARSSRGHRLPVQYRLMRQPTPIATSSLTGWEAPDPVWWVAQGYAVVNADLRGAGTSGGTGTLLSDREGEDVHDLVEWAARQPWSSGGVGLLGVSYLALSQYKAAALHPPGLRAICPWEGFTDAYRDLFTPGGVYENGFASLWSRIITRSVRLTVALPRQRRRHPLRDGWWQSLVPELAAIEVPMLVCASFSDNCVHSRGSFRAFEQVGSSDRFAYTHRGGKWDTFYGAPARQAQLAFFERYVRGVDVAAPPRVRLEVREDRDRIVEVREESAWPLASTRWTRLHLASGGALTLAAPHRAGTLTFDPRRQAAAFTWRVAADVELTGPMAATVWVETHGAPDADLVIGVEKWRSGRYVPFEGSYGWGRDRVCTGWQKVSLRRLDTAGSTPYAPVPTLRHPQPVGPGEVVAVAVALGPSATRFRAGECLRLVVAGRWLSTRNPFTGQFPGHYRTRSPRRLTLHWGPDRPAHLLVPDVPIGAGS